MSEKAFLVFGAPEVHEDDIAEVVATLRSGWWGTGPRTARFEADFAAYKGRAPDQAAAVGSCTAALHLALLATGVGPGDEVVTTPLTFCATVNAIAHAGATPVLADIDPATMNLDPAAVEAALTARTRAIVPVHLAGKPCAMEALMRIAQAHDLKVVEDCAHAIETELDGRKAGTFGDFGCFSFYVTKNIATAEGGMVLGRDPEAIGHIRQLALHGMSRDAWKRFGDSGYRHYYVTDLGFKYNMTDLQAALGIGQLARVESNWRRRRALDAYYREAIADLPLRLPPAEGPNERHAHHLFPVRVEESACGLSRDAMLAAMTERGIGVGVHYQSVAVHPYYQARFGWRPEQWPEAHRIGSTTMSLPLGATVTDADAERVVATVGAILAHA